MISATKIMVAGLATTATGFQIRKLTDVKQCPKVYKQGGCVETKRKTSGTITVNGKTKKVNKGDTICKQDGEECECINGKCGKMDMTDVNKQMAGFPSMPNAGGGGFGNHSFGNNNLGNHSFGKPGANNNFGGFPKGFNF